MKNGKKKRCRFKIYGKTNKNYKNTNVQIDKHSFYEKYVKNNLLIQIGFILLIRKNIMNISIRQSTNKEKLN